jgi:hypothetical protein
MFQSGGRAGPRARRIANGQSEASKNSYNPALALGDDGSADLFFGPEPPPEGPGNRIRTLPGTDGSPSSASTVRSRATWTDRGSRVT